MEYETIEAFKSNKLSQMSGLRDIAEEHREVVTKIRLINSIINKHPFLSESQKSRFKELVIEIGRSDPSISSGYSTEYLTQVPTDQDVQRYVWE